MAKGKAEFKHKSCIRCIVLHKTNIPKVRKASRLALRIDPGSRTTSIALTRDHQDNSRNCLMAVELSHRGKNISNRMSKRRKLRRNRRYRKTRFRQPRFDNRMRKEGWLPPSIQSRLQNTLTWIRRISALLPLSEIHVETNTFDPQLLQNPEIKGTEYQQGPLYRTNLRTAVLARDGNKCVYCGKKNKLELDHAVPKARNGPDRHDNLVTSCTPCNRKKDNSPLEVFLKRRPGKLREIQAKLGMPLASAAHMNIILPELLRQLRSQSWKVTEHAAATTAASRLICEIEKSHHGDAAVTGCPTGLTHIPEGAISITATGRGNRQRIMPDKYGTPKGRGFREYSRLPRHIQRVKPTPSHKKRQKRVGGISTEDYVRFVHREENVQGYGTISHTQVALTNQSGRA